jgi:hypothetical protein
MLPDGGCPVVTTVLDNVSAWSVALAGDDIVFMDMAGGPVFDQGAMDHTRAIRKIRKDGTGDVVLHTAPAGSQIKDFIVQGTTIFFVEGVHQGNGLDLASVYSLSASGGMPQLIGAHDDPSNGSGGDPLDAIVAVDANAVYLVRNILAPASLFRMAIAGGAESTVHVGAIDSRPQLVGASLYFLSGGFPGMVNYKGIAKLGTGAMSTPTQVGMTYCKAGITAGDWGFACAGAQPASDHRVFKIDPAGASATELFAVSPDSSGITARVGPSDGVSVWVTGSQQSSGAGNVYKVPLAGGAATVTACARGEIKRHGEFFAGGGSNAAYTNGLDMVVSATDVIWVEKRKDMSGEHVGIYRAAK